MTAAGTTGLGVRAPREAAGRAYDLVVVGGGVQGVMLTLEAARRGLRPVLLERGDFGGATSANSLRIVHGGFRYLQSLDLPRVRESVGERRWFLRHFPDLVQPLRCLMPLYGEGLRRPRVLRAALALNDALSRGRNRNLRADRAIPAGEVLDAGQVIEEFPLVDRTRLAGGAVWYDAVMRDPQRLLVEALRWAHSFGAVALNYVEAGRLVVRDGRVAALQVVDRETGERLEFRAPVVVNCAGPWSREVARRLDRDLPALFQPSLAFNVLLDRAPLSASALAVAPREPGARTYFMHPWRGRVLAGTFHAPWSGGVRDAAPTPAQLAAFLADLNAAVPDWGLRERDVVRVYAGLLPAATPGTDRLAARETIHDHARHGGPRGLYSVSGVKFTTARLVAEKTLRAIRPGLSRDPDVLAGTERPVAALPPDYGRFAELWRADPDAAAALIARLVREEAVVRMEDLVERRTGWALDPAAPPDLPARLEALLATAARRRAAHDLAGRAS
ncbi:MAG TPA: FAD-dependent oxidoreductase [Gemmatimonadales bacterium]|nr:FAD-dependent oxidoreductase [Gemmatimonadales bacterium]